MPMNHDLWWRLPGPSRFIDEVMQDFRDGKNVIICIPDWTSAMPLTGIRTTVDYEHDWGWETLRINAGSHMRPIDMLFERFAPEAPFDLRRNVNTLAQMESFCGRIIAVEMNDSSWPEWKEFINEYKHACTNQSYIDRTLFCVFLKGRLALDCLNEDITLSVRRWHGNVDYYDILLYSAYLYKERAPSQLHGQVAIAIIASLAMWDSEVAERLAREDLQTIFHPLPFLIDMAAERGWAGDQDCSWCEGQLNVFNCDERMHSVMAALKQPKEIERRIWSAQIGVLMPYVEQGRQYVIDRIRSYLKVPYMTSYGTVVDNLHDLEIGQIENQIHERGVYIDSEIYQLVKRLRKIRNLLAHLEIVDLDLLADSNVVNAI